MIVDAIMTYWS